MPRYAIADPHGCARTLAALLDQIQLSPSDELYLLGDYVNKGPDARGVFDLVLDLRKRAYQLTLLRGNHDQELLDAATAAEDDRKDVQERWQEKLEWAVTLDSFGIAAPHQLQPRYRKLLESTAFYVELPDYVLVHAGLNFAKPAKLWQDTDAMLCLRGYEVEAELLGGRPLLHGHTPTPLVEIRRTLRGTNLLEMSLDAGCVYYKNATMGNLVALNLDSRELTVQPNVDRPYPISRK